VVLLFDLVLAYKVLVREELSRFVMWLSLDLNRINPALHTLTGQGILYEMRVQVDQFRVLALGVNYADEIKRLVVLSSSDAYSLVEVKHPLEAVEVLRLY